ncbi:gamma-glutamyl-gamma-aminobutyrate hydrolase family protein [Candidatus Woesebacteria bacterium]|nr:gamma-glutamyl-gamma-aminobutyrate hydrolase family protein [Candidatus Woesebacteria bacterium]
MIRRSEHVVRKDILSEIPVLESRPIEGFTKYPGFRGIQMNPVLEQARFLLRPAENLVNNRAGIRVLADTSRIIDGDRALIGHLANYDLLLPDSAQIFELPVNQGWSNQLQLVSEVADQFDAIMIRGGKHVGRVVVPGSLAASPSAQTDGGYDDRGDQIDVALILAVLKNPNIFLDATCRGFQLVFSILTQQPPEEISGHRAKQGDPEARHFISNIVEELYGPNAPGALATIQNLEVNSYHHQGYRLETLYPFLDQLKRHHGIYITHVSPDGMVEMAARVNRGEITAILKQFHLEKMKGNPVGNLVIDWQKEATRRAVL